MIAHPYDRAAQIRRLAAWVLTGDANAVDDRLRSMSEREVCRIFAGAQANDEAYVEHLRSLSLAGLGCEAPFAAQHHRGHEPSDEDRRARVRVFRFAPGGPAHEVNTEPAAAATITASRVPRLPRSRPDSPPERSPSGEDLAELSARVDRAAPRVLRRA